MIGSSGVDVDTKEYCSFHLLAMFRKIRRGLFSVFARCIAHEDLPQEEELGPCKGILYMREHNLKSILRFEHVESAHLSRVEDGLTALKDLIVGSTLCHVRRVQGEGT